MFCTACGLEMSMEHRYCSRCGKAAHDGQFQWNRNAFVPRRLERDVYNRSIAGVCAGWAKYLNWDISATRLAFVALVLLTGVPLLAYPICWLVMPRNDVQPMAAPQMQYR